MPAVIVYLLKVNLAVLLFYLGYRLLLRRLTFYTLNRFYLLFSLVFSFGYPLVDVSQWMARSEKGIPAEVVYVIPDWRQVPTETFDGWAWIVGLLVIGSVWYAVRLVIRLLSLLRIHRQSRFARWQWFSYRQVFVDIQPFSFWRYIYVNVHHHEQRDLLDIFTHEQIHVEEMHTLDVLLAEICSVCAWFNPAIWLLRAAIHENLEFITDRKVLSSGVDKKVYQYSLLSIGQQGRAYPTIGNGFTYKSLKRRIMMMNKGKSPKVHLGRYLLAIPVITVFVLVFTVSRAYEYQEEGRVIVEDSTGSKPPWWSDLPSERQAKRVVKVTADTANTQPLILVDGETYEGDVNDIDPKAIESIDVLKGKAATEKYGSKGKDGVVLIALKEGQKVRLKVRSAANVATVTDSAERREKQVFTVYPGKQPLLFIDGEEVSSDALNSLDPNTITNVSILKDEAAKALHGKRGANGVVLITTKVKDEETDLPKKDTDETIRITGYRTTDQR